MNRSRRHEPGEKSVRGLSCGNVDDAGGICVVVDTGVERIVAARMLLYPGKRIGVQPQASRAVLLAADERVVIDPAGKHIDVPMRLDVEGHLRACGCGNKEKRSDAKCCDASI